MFYLFGNTTAFLALCAPLLTLLAWLMELRVWPMLLLALCLTPVVFTVIMSSLTKSHNMLYRWICMQALGLGTVLMPLVAAGALFTFTTSNKTVGVVVLLLWLILSAIACWQAHRINIKQFDIHSPKLKQSVRLLQLSDIHVGSRSKAFLTRVVDIANMQKPEIVVITGDLLDSSTVSANDLQPLKEINCPVYMCIGNHERYVRLDTAIEAISSMGVNVLRDEKIRLDPITIIGVDDRDKPDVLPTVLANIGVNDSQFNVLLYHRPDGWDAALEHNIDITLAGHTHAGQMWPFGYLVKRQYPNMAGLFTKNKNTLFVSTGTGTWGPIFRLGTRCEMTVIDLKVKNN